MSTGRTTTLTARAAIAATLACAVACLLAAPAQAAAYRYWTYWQSAPGESAWVFATQGAGTWVPADGAVEGWSFAISTETAAADAAPATAADFATVCEGVAAAPGTKRVALVIDPGPATIAPDGEQPIRAVAECIQADEDATGYDIVRSVVEVRTEDGLVCGLGGYPAQECAPILDDAQVALITAATEQPVIEHGDADPTISPATDRTDPAASDQGAPEERGTPVATLAVIGLLALGALAVLWLRKRRP